MNQEVSKAISSKSYNLLQPQACLKLIFVVLLPYKSSGGGRTDRWTSKIKNDSVEVNSATFHI